MATSCAAAAGGALLEQPRLGLQALAAEARSASKADHLRVVEPGAGLPC
jgi:hypothetical protein